MLHLAQVCNCELCQSGHGPGRLDDGCTTVVSKILFLYVCVCGVLRCVCVCVGTCSHAQKCTEMMIDARMAFLDSLPALPMEPKSLVTAKAVVGIELHSMWQVLLEGRGWRGYVHVCMCVCVCMCAHHAHHREWKLQIGGSTTWCGLLGPSRAWCGLRRWSSVPTGSTPALRWSACVTGTTWCLCKNCIVCTHAHPHTCTHVMHKHTHTHTHSSGA